MSLFNLESNIVKYIYNSYKCLPSNNKDILTKYNTANSFIVDKFGNQLIFSPVPKHFSISNYYKEAYDALISEYFQQFSKKFNLQNQKGIITFYLPLNFFDKAYSVHNHTLKSLKFNPNILHKEQNSCIITEFNNKINAQATISNLEEILTFESKRNKYEQNSSTIPTNAIKNNLSSLDDQTYLNLRLSLDYNLTRGTLIFYLSKNRFLDIGIVLSKPNDNINFNKNLNREFSVTEIKINNPYFEQNINKTYNVAWIYRTDRKDLNFNINLSNIYTLANQLDDTWPIFNASISKQAINFLFPNAINLTTLDKTSSAPQQIHNTKKNITQETKKDQPQDLQELISDLIYILKSDKNLAITGKCRYKTEIVNKIINKMEANYNLINTFNEGSEKEQVITRSVFSIPSNKVFVKRFKEYCAKALVSKFKYINNNDNFNIAWENLIKSINENFIIHVNIEINSQNKSSSSKYIYNHKMNSLTYKSDPNLTLKKDTIYQIYKFKHPQLNNKEKIFGYEILKDLVDFYGLNFPFISNLSDSANYYIAYITGINRQEFDKIFSNLIDKIAPNNRKTFDKDNIHELLRILCDLDIFDEDFFVPDNLFIIVAIDQDSYCQS